MAANKVTTTNFKPTTAANSILVRAKQFNEMIDVLNEVIDGTTSLTEVEVGNGTAAAPSMSFTSDADTGIYRSAADEVAISTAGVGQVKVTDGTVEPITDNDVDLGTSSKEFKNLYLQGVITQSATTDSTTKDTGSIITEGGIGVEKAIFAGTTVNAGTALTVGTSATFAKEVNHAISVATTTTAATVGGGLDLQAGTGATSGNGGLVRVIGGTGGATVGSTGGAAEVTSGVSGAGTGPSGAVNIKSGAATDANTGVVTVESGVPTTTGNSGNIVMGSGTGSATGNTGTVIVSSGAATTGDSGAVTFKSGNATTGAAGNVNITAGNGSTTSGSIVLTAGNGGTDGTVDVVTNGSTQWVFNASGALNPATDNAHDIGNSSVNPRDIYITRGIKGISANFGVRGIADATCTLETYTTGKDMVSIITLTDFIVGDMGAAAAAKAFGNLIFTFPAGVHVYTITQFNVGFTGAGTANTPDVGLGSEIGSGVVATLNLSGTGTGLSEDYVTGQTANNITGTAEVIMLAPTAGLYTGIALNQSGDVKLLHLNAASTWAADNAGNLTATGTITLKWSVM